MQEDSEEHALEGSRDLIYRKYQDVLNIKAILVLSKGGVCIYNHPVTGSFMDGDLIAGFIQATISFSQEGVREQQGEVKPPATTEVKNGLDFIALDREDSLALAVPGSDSGSPEIVKNLYELNYQKFVLLVHDTPKIRAVLICDHQPGFQLKTLLANFSALFEKIFGEALGKFVGDVSAFEDAHLVVEKIFETDLLFPYAAKLISPVEEEALENLEQHVYRSGLDRSQKTGFFFIAKMVEELKGVLQKPARDIIHAIYELLKMEYFVPQQIETAATYMDEVKVSKDKMQKEGSSVSAIYGKPAEEEIKALNDGLKFTSEKEAKALFKQYMSTGSDRLELGIYGDAMKNFELARMVARGVGLTKELETVNAKIEQVETMIQTLEYNNAMKIAVTAEKNKDYLKAVQYYNNCKKILDEFKDARNDKRIKEIERRIINMQSKIR
nr:hypothetical protein [Candidatus Sigynarchaeota archaeon]